MFVPGVDLGLAYSPGMTELMKCKLPQAMHSDFIVFGKRFTCVGTRGTLSLSQHGVVAPAQANAVLTTALSNAQLLKSKARHRETLSVIKSTLYHEAISALELEPDEVLTNLEFHPMGFEHVPYGQDKPQHRDSEAKKRKLMQAKATQASLHGLEQIRGGDIAQLQGSV